MGLFRKSVPGYSYEGVSVHYIFYIEEFNTYSLMLAHGWTMSDPGFYQKDLGRQLRMKLYLF